MKVTKFLNCKKKKKVLRIISGVNNHTSCRQIFKDYNILTSSLYTLYVTCFIKKYKDFMAKIWTSINITCKI
jgi:hypothetical protein